MDLNWRQRIQRVVFGKVKVGKRRRPGWKAPIMFYAFKCEKHGLVENIPRGYYKPFKGQIPVKYKGVTSELRCPLCQEEKWKYA